MEIMEAGVAPSHRAELPAGHRHAKSPEAGVSTHREPAAAKTAAAEPAHAVRKECHSTTAEPAVKTATAKAATAHAAARFRSGAGEHQSESEGDAHAERCFRHPHDLILL